MVNQQVLDYIRQQLSTGNSKENIQKALATGGWNEQDINTAFLTLKGAQTIPSVAQQIPSTQIDSVGQEEKVLVTQHRSLEFGMWALTVALFAGIFWFFYIVLGHNSMSSITGNNLAMYLLVMPIVLPVLFYRHFKQQARDQMAQQVAQSFGYSYAQSAPKGSVSGMIFPSQSSSKISDVLSGTYRNYPVRIFTYQYTVSTGKSSRTFYDTVCELTYPSSLPHVLLLQRNGPTFFYNLSIGQQGLKKIQLEGDFGKYFDLYIDPGAQIEVREILQPDTMQDLIQSFTGYDTETKENKVYFLQRNILSTRADYIAFRQLADTLIDKLIPGFQAVTDDNKNTSTSQLITSAA